MDTYKHRVDKEQKADSFVFQMHVNSGLWEDAEKGAWTDITPFAVEQKFVDKLNEWGVSKDDPMVGSSIQFDREMLREQMPEVEKCFSYRNIDTSSIKELCRRFNPELYSRIDEHTRNAKAHRVLSDIEDTVSELKFYVDNFLFCWEE
jgi:oligoribonuclease